MKKSIFVKLLMYFIATSFMASSFCGCNTSGNDVGTGSEVLSETVVDVDSSVTNETLTTSEDATEEKVSEEVSETSEETSEETSAESTEESTEAPTEEPTEAPSEELPTYTVEDMSATMYAQKPVNVRSGPSTDHDKIGGLSKNQEVTVTGKASTGWYRISYNGTDGFVAASYLGNEKVVEPSTEQPPSEQPPSEPPTEQPPSDPPSGGENMEEGVFLYPALLDKINAFRRECGRTEVTWNSAKEAEAIARAEYVGLNRAINHDGMPSDAMAEVVCCENGFTDEQGMGFIWDSYMNSDGHRSSIAWELNTSCVVATYRYYSELGGFYQYYNVIIFY